MPTDAKPKPRAWTVEQLLFMEWLALPATVRQPKTQRALAAKLGKDEATLSDWKRLPGFHEARLDAVFRVTGDRLGAVIDAIASHAIEGSTRHAEMFLEMHGLIGAPAVVRMDVTQTGETPSLEAAHAKLYDLIHRRLNQPAGDAAGEPAAGDPPGGDP